MKVLSRVLPAVAAGLAAAAFAAFAAPAASASTTARQGYPMASAVGGEGIVAL